jgi:putative membrane protein
MKNDFAGRNPTPDMVSRRRWVPAVAATLSLVSVALVFAAALGAVPAGALPRASEGVLDAVPHANAVLSTAALVTVAVGVRAVRAGRVRRHRALMLTTFVLFLAFLTLYLYKVVLVGPASFPGPPALYRWLYLPVLAVHVLLAVVCIPLVYYVLLLAAAYDVPELASTPHPRVGRVAAALWFVSFALGDAVYAMLYLVPW